MKNTLIAMSAAVAAAVLMMQPDAAQAQNARISSAPGTPPVGRLVEISLTPYSATQFTSEKDQRKITGTLVAMTDRWIVLQEGSYENWVPMDRVVVMRANR